MLAILTSIDYQLFIWINSLPHASLLDALAGGLWGFGVVGVWWLLVVLQQFIITKRRDILLAQIAVSFSASYIVSDLILKQFFQRPRPGSIIPDAVIHAFGSSSTFAFPSSHAAVSFAVAFMLSRQYPILTPFHFGFATIIALSRVYIGLHFPSDIIYGALVGTLIGWVVVQCAEYVDRKLKK